MHLKYVLKIQKTTGKSNYFTSKFVFGQLNYLLDDSMKKRNLTIVIKIITTNGLQHKIT